MYIHKYIYITWMIDKKPFDQASVYEQLNNWSKQSITYRDENSDNYYCLKI